VYLCVNRIFEILSIRRRGYFFSLRGQPLSGRLSTVLVSRNLFQQLINTTLCPAFLKKFVYQPLCCVPLKIQTFYRNLVLVAECHVGCWQTLQWRLVWRIFGATNSSQKKQVKEQWHGHFICTQYGERLAILNIENIKICRWITLQAIKMQFVCVFFQSAENLNF